MRKMVKSMPMVTATPVSERDDDDIQLRTAFIGLAHTSNNSYTYPTAQESLIIRNRSDTDFITVTVNGSSYVIPKNGSRQITASFTTFDITSTSNSQAFDATAIKAVSNKTSGGGSGVLVVSDVTELQTSYPNGSASPVWVTSENSWYYWSGTIPTPDTVPPTVTPSLNSGTYVGTQSVTLAANELATIYYSLDGSAPSLVYSSALSISANTTLKYYATDQAGNSSAVQTTTYTITQPDSTPPDDPTNFSAGTPTGSTVPLTWTASAASDLSKYEIAYTTNGTDFIVANANVTGTSYTVINLTANTNYTFRITAIDTSSNRSASSPTVQATTAASSWVTSGLVTKWDNRTTQLALTNDGSYFPTSTDFTVVATFKPKAFLNIFSQYDISKGTENTVRLFLDSTGKKVNVSFWGTNNAAAGYFPSIASQSDITLDTATYYHVSLVRNATSAKIYVNNVLYATVTWTNPPFTLQANVNTVQVKVADATSDVKSVAYYNRELNTSELTQNYDALK